MSSTVHALESEGEGRPLKRARVDASASATDRDTVEDTRDDPEEVEDELEVQVRQEKPTRASDLYLDPVR